MARRDDIKTILVIGAGPIVIGQACEFDYSGTQGCYALKEEGYRVVLVNSNPATIMTDPDVANKTYIEPICPEIVEKIIKKEKPDAILPTLGGQTALNCTMQLHYSGVLSRLGVEILGSGISAIENAENRSLFQSIVKSIGLKLPNSISVSSLEEAMNSIALIGFPAIIRASFTLGGCGGGIAKNIDEFKRIVELAFESSVGGVVQIDQSLIGWKEYEMEVMKDVDGNCIMVCSIENIDPMGVHTGDSVTVAPAITLLDKDYQVMRDASFAIIKAIGIKAGGANIQFAINPENGDMVVVEANPRVSRSSALASKATGYPIAKIAAKLAVGYRLHELINDCAGISACAEPTMDYVVIKMPKFNFDKFPDVEQLLSPVMKSVGEVMAIGRCFNEALQKAFVSLEESLTGVNEIINVIYKDQIACKNFFDLDSETRLFLKKSIIEELGKPLPYRIRLIADALRIGIGVSDVVNITKYNEWFVEQINKIVQIENFIMQNGMPDSKEIMVYIKKNGFSDTRIAELVSRLHGKISDIDVYNKRHLLSVLPVYKNIDSCAAEFDSKTSYLYSCYENTESSECESVVSNKKKVIIFGSGPNRIGQGIEFDYACVQACIVARDLGVEAIMVNCNPETVSTDYTMSDKLYFEPLNLEHVLSIIDKESLKGELLGVVVQLGGQTPLKLGAMLVKYGVKILGTSFESIDLCEDRGRFRYFVNKFNLRQTNSVICDNLSCVIDESKKIEFPILIRPSYVLGGHGMTIVKNKNELESYIENNSAQIYSSILVDHFLEDAMEIDVDAVSDGHDVVIVGIMEHIENAGVHSGDSSCIMPHYLLKDELVENIIQQTVLIGKEAKIIGLLNIQYAIKDNEIYVLEVNPRASRTIPFVSKVLGFSVVGAAVRVMLGQKISTMNIPSIKDIGFFAIKKPVFSFSRFPGINNVLRPEMKSTGEIMSIDKNFDVALLKTYIATGSVLKNECNKNALISVRDEDKDSALIVAKKFSDLGFSIFATKGTANFFIKNNIINVSVVNKVADGSPHVVDLLTDGKISYVLNTTNNYASTLYDCLNIRSVLLFKNIPYSLTVKGALFFINAFENAIDVDLSVNAIQDLYSGA